jgi:phosphatidate cytidylyltransferase
LYQRWKGWCWVAPALIVPILLGVFWTILGVFILSLLCFHEYARTTGLFREKIISFCVIAGILLVAFASLDGFPRLFFALAPLTVAVIAASTLQSDRPAGYIQRVALGVFGFLLFGYSLGYLGQIAAMNDIVGDLGYRPVLLLILIGVSLNDVFAYCVGKSMGHKKLLPNTSPGKTVAGSVGALILTTLLVAFLGHFVFDETPMDTFWHLMTLGFMVSGLGQLGDLILSSIKRDVGVKDTGRIIPGHGGLLDRFNSLLLVPPAVYHYVSLNLDQPIGVFAHRIFTGG